MMSKQEFIMIFTAMAVVAVIISVLYWYVGRLSAKQQAKVKEWLIWACIEAERLLQSGTGQLKLREVWNLFCAVPAFTFVARIISFDVFSVWVSDALKTAKAMLISNQTLAKYVYGDNAIEETDKLKKQLEGEDEI